MGDGPDIGKCFPSLSLSLSELGDRIRKRRGVGLVFDIYMLLENEKTFRINTAKFVIAAQHEYDSNA